MNGLINAGQDVEPLRILVVEHRLFERRLIAETLRAVRDLVIEYAESSEQCLNVLADFRPDVLIADWDLEDGKGLDLVRRIRHGDGERRATPIVMVAAETTAADVEAARNAGVDEFVLRPFSTAILTRRAHTVRETKRDFIESPHYVGPCRRKRRIKDYDGPRRRTLDASDQRDDTPDLQIRKGLACMYVERIGVLVRTLKSNDPEGVRELCLACAQLRTLANDMSDRLLTSAAASLFDYLKGCGARGKLDTDVVQAHLDALLQLAQLPNCQIDLRQTVTEQLQLLVARKLHRAGAAA